jgi:uncharacterized protein involved in exopolysaccharide biosynthesis
MDLAARNLVDDSPELTLKELLALLRRRAVLVACFAVFCVAATGIFAWLSPPKYRAEIVVSPVASTGGGGQLSGLGSVLSQVGGLASLAGLGGASGDTHKAESLAVLKSEALTEKYIGDNHLLTILYAGKWDAQHKRWNESDPRKIPSLWKANLYFEKDVRTISLDTKTGLVTLTIVWSDPNLAATWANGLVKLTNEYLRAKAIDESERNIAYLNEQAAKTDVLPVKQAIYAILQSEINKEMLARGSEEYAFKILDPAAAPEVPFSPRPKLWMFFALIGSLVFSVIAAYVYLAWQRL